MPKCEHQGCECETNQRFCSDKCREAQVKGQAAGSSAGCGCGHPDCES